ncbi:UDP-glucose 4-epimerase [Planctomycetes bacterium Pan216]|uniref:UDP-glucose 4-epimerase n=1 Tax=Kolteria novifilia TaxID=2527975 RepID=A0A518BBQ3_9BACT|nr:UDP-glucose 4-epimerase [Planctomycetes bacterium Pan216]
MKVLVVGGAGYIGSHTVRALRDVGHDPIIFDNLVTGHAAAVQRLGVPFVEGDLNHPVDIYRALNEHRVEAVMHFAAFCYVGESVRNPSKYYQNNVVGTIQLLEAMRSCAVKLCVFSSTCATYGVPTAPMLNESHPQRPINPYGWTKLMVEQMLVDYDHAYGMKYAALRYFNASGSSADGLLGEDHTPETHLIPLCLLVAKGVRDNLSIFGTDYDTFDGTCIRDFIHVEDLAEAHVRALDHLSGKGESLAINIGTGTGHSVREVVRCTEEVTGLPVHVVESPRRDGDAPVLVADATMARDVLNWRPKYTELKPIVETAWKWFQQCGHYPKA